MSFRFFGIPVVVAPAFLILVGLLGLDRVQQPKFFLELSAAAFLSVLWHELGHAWAFRRFGLSPAIELHGMGGHTTCGDAPLSRGRHAIASLCGPLFGFLLAGSVMLLPWLRLPAPHSSLAYMFRRDLLWINVAWSIFNLLPILPMDGGQVFCDLLQSRWSERGEAAARRVSIALATAGGLWSLVHGRSWTAFLGLWFVSLNWRALQAQSAERVCRAVLAKLQAAKLDDAWSEFKKIPPAKVHDHLLRPLASALFSAKRFEEALQLEVVAFYRTKKADHAYNAGCSLARLGRGADALEWLGRAVDAGYDDRRHLESDADLAGLRDQAGWQTLLARVKERSGPS